MFRKPYNEVCCFTSASQMEKNLHVILTPLSPQKKEKKEKRKEEAKKKKKKRKKERKKVEEYLKITDPCNMIGDASLMSHFPICHISRLGDFSNHCTLYKKSLTMTKRKVSGSGLPFTPSGGSTPNHPPGCAVNVTH